MSLRMYRPEKKSRMYIYVFCFFAALIGWAMFLNLRPLTIEATCSQIAEQTSGQNLRARFDYDPYSSYDYVKAQCLEEVFTNKNSK